MASTWIEQEQQRLTQGMEKGTHELPPFEFVVNDSPSCHQSLKYWGQKSKEVRKSIGEVAACLSKYHTTGLSHKASGEALGDAFDAAAKVFKDDSQFHDPLMKFSDAINRIECYREMLLNQTHMLGVQPLNEIVRGIKKDKELKSQLKKANESYHVAWEKFAHSAHLNNLPEPSHLDKSAHSFLNARENYQLHLASYIQTLRETHSVKKTSVERETKNKSENNSTCHRNHNIHQVLILQRVLEHMLAQFSFFNFSYQLMKELEPHMSEVFENLKTKFNEFEENLKEDFAAKQSVTTELQRHTVENKKLFPLGDHSGFSGASAMHSINASTGKFFTRVSGIFSSGVQGVKDLKGKSGKDTTDSKSKSSVSSEPDWEVIETPDKKSARESDISIEEPTGFLKSAEEITDEPDATKDASRTQFYLPLDENNEKGNNMQMDNSGIHQPVVDGKDEDLIGRHKELNHDDSTLSLTDILGNSNSDSSLMKRGSMEDALYKRGYLRIKQKAFPKSRFPLLYFIVDKKNGDLMAQGEDQPYPTLFSSLMLSTVRECDPEDTDRNFCFQLITSSKEHTFQAISNQEMKEWMKAIQEGIVAALNQSQERIRSIVRARSQSGSKSGSQKRKPKVYVENAAERIRAVEGNNYCSDCSSPRPDWASTNIGVVFCIECSGVHRSLGVHISKVKSLTLDRWEEEYVERMEQRGNLKMNSILEGKIGSVPKPTRESSKDERRQFIIKKYVDRKFSVPSQSDEPDGGELDLDLTFDSSTEDELLKDEVDCKKGLHGHIYSPTGDFSSSLLQMGPTYDEIQGSGDEEERTVTLKKSDESMADESQC